MRGAPWIQALKEAKANGLPAAPRGRDPEYSPVALGAGNVHVLVEHVRPRTGTVIGTHEERVKNHVVLSGRNIIRDMILNIGPAPTHMAFGSGTADTKDSDRRLGSEQYRAEFTRRYAAGSKAIFKNFLAAAEPSNQPFQIAEIGIFSVSNYVALAVAGGFQSGSAVQGLLYARALITEFEKNDSTQVTFTWELPITSVS